MSIEFIIGRKVGMTRIFDDFGMDFPVTVIEAGPCNVTQIKSSKVDGYTSVQIGFSDKNSKNVNRSQSGHFNKAGISPKAVLKEFLIDSAEGFDLGMSITAEQFNIGDFVSVSGVSKGKGFAGHMKRHGFGGGRRSHGKNSVMRKAGSIGAGSDPSRVWPGTRMAGRMGGERKTIQNLEVARIDIDKNLLFLKGAVPGAKNGIICISKVMN
jgi:large subunit ribosomal protein L3